jgi:CRP-like cAMP-binding protein
MLAMTPSGTLRSLLEASPWWASLTSDQVDRLDRDVFIRSFQAGATVCPRGSPAVHWLGVAEGLLKVDTVAPDGRATTFAGVPSGSWFGEGAVLKGEMRPYSVVAIRDSLVAFVPRATFQWLIDESHPFSRWVIDQLNARLGHYVAMIESFRLHHPTARVAYCLSEFFNPQLSPHTTSQLAISQEELGRLSGMSRQNTNRALHELEQLQLLRVRYGLIEVLDLDKLRQFAWQD